MKNIMKRSLAGLLTLAMVFASVAALGGALADAATGLKIDPGTLTITDTADHQITYKGYVGTSDVASDATSGVSWASSDSGVATVTAITEGSPATETNKANVKAVKNGTAKITVTTTTPGLTSADADSCNVTVNVPVTAVGLNKSTSTLTVGSTETLTATVTTALEGNKGVKWTSSDETVASVDQNGKVTALKAGTAKITATSTAKYYDGNDSSTAIKGECSYTVNAPASTPTLGITSNNGATLSAVNATLNLTATLTNPNATTTNSSTVTWAVDTADIVSLSNTSTVLTNGIASIVLTAKKAGTVTVTATAPGGVKATFVVTVSIPKPVITLTVEDSNTDLTKGETTNLIIHVDNPTSKTVTITRATKRVYLSAYTVTLDSSNNATVKVNPQYNGSVVVTVKNSGADNKTATFNVSGFSALPQTGQDMTFAYVVGAICLVMLSTAVILHVRKAKKGE